MRTEPTRSFCWMSGIRTRKQQRQWQSSSPAIFRVSGARRESKMQSLSDTFPLHRKSSYHEFRKLCHFRYNLFFWWNRSTDNFCEVAPQAPHFSFLGRACVRPYKDFSTAFVADVEAVRLPWRLPFPLVSSSRTVM